MKTKHGPHTSFRSFGVVLLTALSLMSVACSKKEDTKTYEGGRSARTNGANSSDPARIANQANFSLAAQLYMDDETTFNDQVRKFVSSVIPQEMLGYVSAGNLGDGTGVFFGGKVILAGCQANQYGNMQVATNSQILIAVYDEYAGSKDESGKVIDPVASYIGNGRGTVQGDNVSIQFSDNYGSVTLIGTLDDTNFEGEMQFSNKQSYDGGGGASGSLGSFRIPINSFFVCN